VSDHAGFFLAWIARTTGRRLRTEARGPGASIIAD